MNIKDIFNMYLRPHTSSVTPEKKSHTNGQLTAFSGHRQALWTSRNYTNFAHEGFQQNAVAYRCVRMIAESAATIPVKLFSGLHEVTEHPLLNLLYHPNREQSLPDILEYFYAYLQVSGNSYMQLIRQSHNDVGELHVLRPDMMKIVLGKKGWPIGYEYTVNNQSIYFDAVNDNICPILHLKLFHPLNEHYGMSPMEAAGLSIDIHNSANHWNKALFDNAARPSGALVYRGPEGAPNLTDEQFQRLKSELEKNYQGQGNAGRPLLLEGGLEWKPISLTPQDMDFIHAKHSAAREVALAFGVPPMLLGIPGDNTYSNYAEANRVFWRQTVLPLTDRMMRRLSQWLSPIFRDISNLSLRCTMDSLPALSDERVRLWERIGKSNFLTVNEKRAALGYGPIENGEHIGQ